MYLKHKKSPTKQGSHLPEKAEKEKATVPFPPRCPNICFLEREALVRQIGGKNCYVIIIKKKKKRKKYSTV